MSNSAKVLLVNAPTDKLYTISIQPPLGILYIASYLRHHGVTVKVVDLNVIRAWKKELKSIISEFEPSTVGLSSNLSNRFNTLQIASDIKAMKRGTDIIVGGPHPTTEPNLYEKPSIDYIIPYEAEQVMLDFIVSGKEGYKKNGKTKILDNKQFTTVDLNTIPFPAYDMIPIEKYYVNSYRRRPLVSVVTSRGCPAMCIFCNQNVFGHTWRSRSAENVVDEMEWLEKKVGVKELSIEDDNFTYDMKRVFEICDLMRSKGINLTWQLANGVRADKLSKELLKEMKNAGCWKLAIAPEVGDKESFIKLRKGGTLDKFRQVARWCKELDIVYYGFFLVGFPFQSQEQMAKTVDFAIELDPLMMDMSKVVPFKGTQLYDDYPEMRLKLKSDVGTYYDKQNDDFLEKTYRNAHYRFYLRPSKIAEIIQKIGFRSFFRFVHYGIKMFYFKG